LDLSLLCIHVNLLTIGVRQRHHIFPVDGHGPQNDQRLTGLYGFNNQLQLRQSYGISYNFRAWSLSSSKDGSRTWKIGSIFLQRSVMKPRSSPRSKHYKAPTSMRAVMDGGRYLCMAIPTVKRHDPSGYMKIMTCKSCGNGDPKYLHPGWQP